LNQVRVQLEQKSDQCVNLQDRYAKLLTDHDILRSEFHSSETKHNHLKNLLNSFLETQKQKYESEFDDFRSQIAHWKSKFEDLDIEKTQTENFLEQIQQELQEYKRDYKRQTAQLKTAKENSVDYLLKKDKKVLDRKKINDLTATKLYQNYLAAQKEQSLLNDNINKLRIEIDLQKQEKTEIEDLLKAEKRSVTQLKSTNQFLRNQTQNLNQLIEKSEAERKVVERKFQELIIHYENSDGPQRNANAILPAIQSSESVELQRHGFDSLKQALDDNASKEEKIRFLKDET